MTAEEIEEQVRAARALTQLRLVQERHDRLFGAGAFVRDSASLLPTDDSESYATEKRVPPEALTQAIARTS